LLRESLCRNAQDFCKECLAGSPYEAVQNPPNVFRVGKNLEAKIFLVFDKRCQRAPACSSLTAESAAFTLKVMEVQLTPDQEAFVRQAIESGRLRREEDAVREAFSLWEERERTRAEILAAVDEAEASLARGEGRIITQESMRELAEQVKRRGRARPAAEPTPTSGAPATRICVLVCGAFPWVNTSSSTE
jgi:Arc/MetJ-type ribon-helix-helix transcriptional regulator